ncbi:hypothetical protein EG329_007567 [Mollisiaceae sp. DMI_Dod_QoI]|nr:hypothetical protein EG329_007567 [Helotiales sp. DMI_Dod_QoI]
MAHTTRVFDPSDYTYAQTELSLVLDPVTKIQQFPFHDETIVIDLGSAVTPDKNTGKMKAAYAIFFGPGSPYNTATLLPENLPQNAQPATLHAALKTLHQIPTINLSSHPPNQNPNPSPDPNSNPSPNKKTLIILKTGQTRGPDFHDHITSTCWEWEANNWERLPNPYRDGKRAGARALKKREMGEGEMGEEEEEGNKVKFAAQYRELHELCEGKLKEGIVVQFWKVERGENGLVDGMAKRVLRG